MDVHIESHKDDILAKLNSGAINVALEQMGLVAERYAKQLCPVDTGRLRNSITHQVAPNKTAVYIGTNVEYAPYVEFGTHRQKAQPYLRPAVTDHIDEYKKIVNDALSSS